MIDEKKTLWHNTKEEPTRGLVLVEYYDYNHSSFTVIRWDTKKLTITQDDPWKYLVWKLRINKWAYIDDIK